MDWTAKVLEVLRAVKEQGLSHQCAMEGYVTAHGGCEDCNANNEAEVEAAIELLEKARGSPPDQTG